MVQDFSGSPICVRAFVLQARGRSGRRAVVRRDATSQGDSFARGLVRAQVLKLPALGPADCHF